MRDREANTQIVIAYYEAARAELVQRLERRDSVVVFYVGAIGAIGGAAATGTGLDGFYLLGLVLPLVALGAAFIYTQHDRAMDLLSQYCEQLAPWMGKVWAESSSEPITVPPSFDQEMWKPPVQARDAIRATSRSTATTAAFPFRRP